MLTISLHKMTIWLLRCYLRCLAVTVWFRGNIQELKKDERWNVYKNLIPDYHHLDEWKPSSAFCTFCFSLFLNLFIYLLYLYALQEISMSFQLSHQLFVSQLKLFLSSWQCIHPVGSFNWLFSQRPKHTDSPHASKNIKLGKWSILYLFICWAKSSQI